MVERRDVELLIRAKDLSSRPLKEVSAALDKISASLATQVEAARKGEVSYQELAQSFKDVTEAGKALAGQQGLIDRFTKLNAESAKLADKVRASSVALREFRESMASGGAATAKQETQLRKLEAAYDRSQSSFQKNQASIAALGQNLEAAGVDTKNLAAAQQQLVGSATQAGQAAQTLSLAMSGYAKNAREAKDATKAMGQSKALQDLVRGADEAVASAQRVASSMGGIRVASSNFGKGLRDIVDPAGEARKELSGLEAQTKELAQVVGQINGPVRNYAETLLQLSAAQRSAVSTGDLIDRFRGQTAAVTQARAAFVAARTDVRAFQQQIAAAGTPSDELTRKLKAAQQALKDSAQQFATLAAAARDTQGRLREAGVDTKNLEDAQRRLAAVANQTAESTKRLQTSFAQFGSAGRGGLGIFGLSPYAVQNLGFQINDFFTQLASGTSASQAFAQQFGQVVQVFGPGAFSAVARWAPLIAGIGAAALTTAAAVARLNETQQSTRNFAARLSVGGGSDAFGVSAEQITTMAREAAKIGGSFDDARVALVAFLNAGVTAGGLQQATEIAVRYARVTGTEVPQAAQLFVRGLTEGRDGFNALLQAGVAFSAQARETITVLLDQGRAAEAQRVIIQELTGVLRAADEQGLSPFQRAARDVRNAWKDALDELGKTGIVSALARAMEQLAERGRQLVGIMRQLRGEADIPAEMTPQQAAAGRTQVAAERLATAQRRVDEGASVFRFGSRREVDAARAALPRLQQELADAQRAEQELANSTTTSAQAQRDAANAARERTAAVQAQIDALQRQNAERRREETIDNKNAPVAERRRAVEERARARAVDRAPSAGDTEAGRRAIQDAIDTDMRAFERKLAEELKTAGNAATTAVRRDFQAIRTDIQETLRVRDEAVRGIQEDVAAGALSPAEAIERIQAAADQARPALQRLAEEARRFRDTQTGGDAVRRAALDGLVAQAERQAGSQGSRTGVRQVLTTQGSEVQRLVQERQQFVQTQDALVNQNAATQLESEQRIQEFYAATNEELSRQIALLQEAAEAARANGDITEGAYRQINAQIQLYQANLQRVDPMVTRLRNTIEQGFVQSVTTAFDTAAQAAGDFLAGVSSLEDAFDKAGRAALQFFADFLKAIGQAILQQQALIVVKSISAAIGGVFHGGGVIGGPPNRTRAVSPSWFANAPRYHSGSGGPIGLRPNEQAAILERGEEVLAKDDPRNIMNAGKASSGAAAAGPQSFRNVLAIGDSEIANAMSGPPGEQVVLNILKRNIATVRTMIR